MWSPRERILVPVDFSEQSRTAFAVARELAQHEGGSRGQIVLVHVLPDLSPVEPGKLWNSVNPTTRIDHATAALREWLGEGNQEADAIEVSIGDPGAEICRVASERGADLIVLPSHGRTGMKRLLVGSVAERVVRLAPCPVLVLRHVHGPTEAPARP